MVRHPYTDLRAYSGRALLTAAVISASLHVALALAVPRWGSGGGLPLLRRPPLLVRMEMRLDLTPQPPLPVGEGERKARSPFPLGKEVRGLGLAVQRSGGGKADSPPSALDSKNVLPDADLNGKVMNGLPTIGEEAEGLLMADRGGVAGDLPSVGDGGGEGTGRQRGEVLEAEELDGEGALEVWEVEEPPKQVVFVKPEYPSLARRMGVEGSVVIRYLVGQEGRVEQMAVVEGPELLQEASLRAVGQFVYEPIRHRGRATKVWMRQVITFRLE